MSPKFIASVFIALLFVMAVVVADVDEEDESDEEPETGFEEEGDSESDKVIIEITSPAPDDCQRKSKRYDQLSMHYVGTISKTGVKFDASYDRNQPFSFQLGAGQVIKGWDEGLTDMCVGEKRKLIIPASKGYGSAGAGALIPPNAGLTFEVHLVSIEDGEKPPNVFKEIDTDDDQLLSHDEVSDYLLKQAAKIGDVPEDDTKHTEILSQIFSHEDTDKDGFISHEEFSGPKHDEL